MTVGTIGSSPGRKGKFSQEEEPISNCLIYMCVVNSFRVNHECLSCQFLHHEIEDMKLKNTHGNMKSLLLL